MVKIGCGNTRHTPLSSIVRRKAGRRRICGTTVLSKLTSHRSGYASHKPGKYNYLELEVPPSRKWKYKYDRRGAPWRVKTKQDAIYNRDQWVFRCSMAVFVFSVFASGALVVLVPIEMGGKHVRCSCTCQWSSPRSKNFFPSWGGQHSFCPLLHHSSRLETFICIHNSSHMSERFVFMLVMLKGYRTLREGSFGLLSVLVKGSILYFLWCVPSYLLYELMIRDSN